jgi:hypothetical protein
LKRNLQTGQKGKFVFAFGGGKADGRFIADDAEGTSVYYMKMTLAVA